MKIPFDIKYKQDIIDGKVKVVTRDGKDVKIVCFDALCSTPIIASVQFEDGISKIDDLNECIDWLEKQGKASHQQKVEEAMQEAEEAIKGCNQVYS